MSLKEKENDYFFINLYHILPTTRRGSRFCLTFVRLIIQQIFFLFVNLKKEETIQSILMYINNKIHVQ